jgi:hypothetical protein
MESAIAGLGSRSDVTSVEEVARFGCSAVPRLVQQLKMIEPRQFNLRDAERHPGDMRVIWSIAALRAITGNDFYASRDPQSKRGSPRLDMLGAGKGRTKFFGIWPSRGIVYFATREQQRRIIGKWRKYNQLGSCRGGSQNRDSEFWLYGRHFEN